MQIVIDISEQDYLYIAKKHCLPSCDDKTLRKYVYEMIVNGTLLPKGHVKLIDAEKLKHAFIKWSMAVQGSFTDSDIASIVYNSSTIIEADKVEVSEK